jgi:hypothetical protein
LQRLLIVLEIGSRCRPEGEEMPFEDRDHIEIARLSNPLIWNHELPASRARVNFQGNIDDVKNYFHMHQFAVRNRSFAQRMHVVNKAIYVLVASLWEAYCEDLATEASNALIENSPSWQSLPDALIRAVSKEIRAGDPDLIAWSLAGDGWREYLRSRLTESAVRRNFKFASPRSDSVDKLFRESIGVVRISESWTADDLVSTNFRNDLDQHVSVRNQIIHEYRRGLIVTKKDVKSFFRLVSSLVAKTEVAVDEVIVKSTGASAWLLPDLLAKDPFEAYEVARLTD